MYGLPDTLSQLYQVITSTLDVIVVSERRFAKNIMFFFFFFLSHSFLGVLVEEVFYVGLFL